MLIYKFDTIRGEMKMICPEILPIVKILLRNAKKIVRYCELFNFDLQTDTMSYHSIRSMIITITQFH